jgi:hypothetical protein
VVVVVGCTYKREKNGLVVAGTWEARDVMCDDIVTPEVRGMGMLMHADAGLVR